MNVVLGSTEGVVVLDVKEPSRKTLHGPEECALRTVQKLGRGKMRSLTWDEFELARILDPTTEEDRGLFTGYRDPLQLGGKIEVLR